MRGTTPLLVLTALMILTSGLSGCINALDSTVDPRASLQAYPLQIQEGEMVTFDARDSSPLKESSLNIFGISVTVKQVIRPQVSPLIGMPRLGFLP